METKQAFSVAQARHEPRQNLWSEACWVQVDALDVYVVPDQVVETFNDKLGYLIGFYVIEGLPEDEQIGLSILNKFVYWHGRELLVHGGVSRRGLNILIQKLVPREVNVVQSFVEREDFE